jgi:hypothetical protein
MRAVIYAVCPSTQCAEAQLQATGTRGALSARVSGEEGPRIAWGFSYLGAAERFTSKPARIDK